MYVFGKLLYNRLADRGGLPIRPLLAVMSPLGRNRGFFRIGRIATRKLVRSNRWSCIDKPARVLIGMLTPRRQSIDSLLPGDKDQSSKVPD
jgi:hypothetical protein